MTDTAGHIANIDSILIALDHDTKTAMPKGSAANRAAQVAVLNSLKSMLQGAPSQAQGSAYEKLKALFGARYHLERIGSTLNKMAETENNPFSAEDQSRQGQTIAFLQHRQITDPQAGALLDEAEKNAAALSATDRRNLELMRRTWVRANQIPLNLVNDAARLESEGGQKHAQNYRGNDWLTMRDWYKFSFDTMRGIGAAQQQKLGMATVYDTLLDIFNPGISAAHIESEFKKLGEALKPLIDEALEKQKNEPAPIPLTGPFPKAQQEELCNRIIKALGFDLDHGRLDIIKGHPSCGGAPDDTRMTTRYDENNFLDAIGTTVHEAGHGMYEQDLPAALRGQPVGEALGMGVHESQSMIIERCVCKSPEFFEYLEREARNVFGRPHDPALNAGNLRRLMMKVQPSFIRVDADELTYPAHVVLRFELEKALIENKITVDGLPQAWSDGLHRLLGIRPSGPSEGWMQDVHWPSGAIGYFPAYVLGAMGAAQFYAAACRAHPEIPAEIAKGNFRPIKTWLEKNVHGKASLLDMDQLFIQATGEKLNARYFIDYLRERFLGKSAPGQRAAPGPAPA